MLYYAAIEANRLEDSENGNSRISDQRFLVHALVKASDQIEAGARLFDLLREQGWRQIEYAHIPVGGSIVQAKLPMEVLDALKATSTGSEAFFVENLPPTI